MVTQLHSQVFPCRGVALGRVVLVHGLLGSLENLGGLARRLTAHWDVYAVDLPSHGRSPWVRPLSIPLLAQALCDWHASMALSQVHWIGHSLGGKAVMELALRHPDCADRLAILDMAPVAYPPRHNRIFAALEAIPLTAMSHRDQVEEQLYADLQDRPLCQFLAKNWYSTANGGAWRMDLAGLVAAYPDLLGANSEPASASVKPALFVQALLSDYLDASHGEPIRRRFAKARWRPVADVGHWLHAQKPDEVAAACHRFLSSPLPDRQ